MAETLANLPANITQNDPSITLARDITSLWAFLMSFTSLRDWFRLILLGGFLETARRFLSTGWSRVASIFFVRAEVESSEICYQWLQVWLSQQSAWNKSRLLQISSPKYGQINHLPAHLQGRVDAADEAATTVSNLQFQPSYEHSCYIRYKGTWLHAMRTRREQGARHSPFPVITEMITITMLTHNHKRLNLLLQDAHDTFKAHAQKHINIYSSFVEYAGWTGVIQRAKRPLGSVILDQEMKEGLLDDAREFLDSEPWYAERGIPWRRGYLLHGGPGSGKTSLIHAIAGELSLDIFVFSLSARGLDDSLLNKIVTGLPRRCIALMEDIDVAFTKGVSRTPAPSRRMRGMPGGDEGVLTLAGLLGAIDGVAAQEGRILFATTNDIGALDPALTRPGRLDVHYKFGLADQVQAAELFKHFYPHTPVTAGVTTSEDHPLIDLSTEKVEIKKPDTTSPVTPKAAKKHVVLSEEEASTLSKRFASQIPPGEFSMASLQGLLMQFKMRPRELVEGTATWIERERQQKLEWEEAKRKRKEEEEKSNDKSAEGSTKGDD